MWTMNKFLNRWGHIVGPAIVIVLGLSFAATGLHLWGAAAIVVVIVSVYATFKFWPTGVPKKRK
jgi:hypothetical protein